MIFEFYPRLSQNFSQLFDDADDFNVILKIGENSDTKEFRAHSIILRARSSYFKRALSQDWATIENNIFTFTKQNISPIIFEMIIRYMYTGILDLKEKDISDVLNLLVASDELLIDELVTFIQNYLIENQIEWLINNYVKVIHTIFKLESCKHLLDYCLESICNDPEPFFNSPEFLTLEKNILLELIKRDDLQIDEIESWNNIIKWGIAQTSELDNKNITDLDKWNKEDFISLKNTLDPFITHIRFFDISSKDFHNKIRPIKKVLPKTLFEDILSFYLTEIQPENSLPPRCGKVTIDSIIIKSNHAAILANWTQRNDANARIPKDKYNFDLIYRGSRDGFSITTMRNKCNRKGVTILVIKVRENGIIIGGYNPFGDGKNFKKVKISRVTNGKNAIYESDSRNIALNFGNGDLVINGTNDFHSNIRPFKKALPKALFKNIVSFYLTEIQPENILPPRHGIISIDSMIIKPKYMPTFLLVGFKGMMLMQVFQETNIIYRGSRDSFDIVTIRSKCFGQEACILFIKAKKKKMEI
ncbi:BTB-domain-containing protein [Rhizophagus irregularis]|nr:BTB-domain-containing protein [Rhizophagus irregularis]